MKSTKILYALIAIYCQEDERTDDVLCLHLSTKRSQLAISVARATFRRLGTPKSSSFLWSGYFIDRNLSGAAFRTFAMLVEHCIARKASFLALSYNSRMHSVCCPTRDDCLGPCIRLIGQCKGQSMLQLYILYNNSTVKYEASKSLLPVYALRSQRNMFFPQTLQ